jgi:DNA excision repair protein ERCC-4
MRDLSAYAGGADEESQLQWAVGESLRSVEEDEEDLAEVVEPVAGPSTTVPAKRGGSPIFRDEEFSGLLTAARGILDENQMHRDWMLKNDYLEDWDTDYGLLSPEDEVIIRPYGGDDDDIMLQELRPRFVIMYEPNLAFIRRLEVGCLSISLI